MCSPNSVPERAMKSASAEQREWTCSDRGNVFPYNVSPFTAPNGQHRGPALNLLASNRTNHSNHTNSQRRQLFSHVYQAVLSTWDHPKKALLLPLYHSQQRKDTTWSQRHLEIQWVATGEWMYSKQNNVPLTVEIQQQGNEPFGRLRC